LQQNNKALVVVVGAQNQNENGLLESSSSPSWLQSALRKGVAPALAGACLSLMAAISEPSLAAEQTLRLKGSPNAEIFEAQKTLVQSWAIVRDSFVGSSTNEFYNKWETELRSALDRTAADGDDVDAAYHEIDSMLGTLGDPYTRFVNPRDYFGVKVQNDGELQGVGLLIASEPSSGRLMVISPIDGSPAARAGIMPGDEVVNIDGKPTRGKINGDQAAGYLRGRHGTVVNLKIRSSGDNANVNDGLGNYRGKPANVQWRQVRLVRDNIVLSPVYSELLSPAKATKAGKSHMVSGNMGNKYKDPTIGYIKLTSFNQKAGSEMAKAMERLKSQGASSFILDLRDNPGGLVNAGLDIAGMWLEPNDVILHTVAQDGFSQTIKVSDKSEPIDAEAPLVVLVNTNSASASEILAGALKDNGRAKLLGSKTFGKGKIQSVFELGNEGEGGALFVTVAKYQTPAHRDIDQVGISPDGMCDLKPSSIMQEDETAAAMKIQEDPCVLQAELTLEESNNRA
jgi:C-terminal processing protease CtpA/Prc